MPSQSEIHYLEPAMETQNNIRRAYLRKKIRKESFLCRKESMRILKEFEVIEYS